MFVPDFLHEFELGVWKAIYTHILRLLHAQGGSTLNEFNKRYAILFPVLSILTYPLPSFRQVPTFGRDTIRRFSVNMSSSQRIAARDYEDMLQVRDIHQYLITVVTNSSVVHNTGCRGSSP